MAEQMIHGGRKPGKRWRYIVYDTRYPDDVYYNTNRGHAADRLIAIAHQFDKDRVRFIDRGRS